MTTKEKLELLWKYLLLVVLVYGFAQMGRTHGPRVFDHKFGTDKAHEMMWFSGDDGDMDEMTVDVEFEKIGDHDSTVVVTINGEKMDLNKFDSKNKSMIIKKIKRSGDSHERKVKIKNKMIKEK